MYKGKYHKRRKARKSPVLVLASLVLVLAMSIAGVSAFISDQSGQVKNTFTLDPVTPTIEETFDKTEKDNVKVGVVDNGNTEAAYIRAVVVATWVKVDGNNKSTGEVYPEAPEAGTDYNIDWTASGWIKGDDGYYYYTSPVAPGGFTGELFTDCKPVENKTPEGYHLSVEILAQTIQADGVDADGKTPVELAWGEAAAKLVGAIE